MVNQPVYRFELQMLHAVSGKYLFLFIGFAICLSTGCAHPEITTALPKQINPSSNYLIYLHGGIVQDQGPEAVSQYFGPYSYWNILDTFQMHGFNVISEVRPKETEASEYAQKVARQVDTLLQAGVPENHITIVGASLGAYIAIETAHQLKRENLRYILLGLCSEYALRYYQRFKQELCGNFLSIYERTDEKGSCRSLFDDPNCKSGFSEVRVELGNGHGFLYRPYPEWVSVLVDWSKGKN